MARSSPELGDSMKTALHLTIAVLLGGILGAVVVVARFQPPGVVVALPVAAGIVAVLLLVAAAVGLLARDRTIATRSASYVVACALPLLAAPLAHGLNERDVTAAIAYAESLRPLLDARYQAERQYPATAPDVVPFEEQPRLVGRPEFYGVSDRGQRYRLTVPDPSVAGRLHVYDSVEAAWSVRYASP